MALPFAARLAAFIARPDRLGRNVAMKREQLIPLANYLKDLTPGTRVSATALGKTFGTKRERIPELAKALDLDIKFGEGKMLKGMKNPYMKEYFEKLVPGSLSGLTKIEKRIIDKNYKSIPVARLAADLSNVPTGTTQSPNVLAKYKQINRYLKSTGKEGLKSKRSDPKGVLREFGKQYQKDVETLMIQSPELKNIKPTTLLARGERAINIPTLREAFSNVPKLAKPSAEHMQGIVPGLITKDPSTLTKLVATSRRFNYPILGASSPLYREAKNRLGIAVRALENNDKRLAKESINKVNQVYDEVQNLAFNKKLISRDKDLPFYKIVNNKIKEVNLKGKPIPFETEPLEKSMFDYLRYLSAYTNPEEIAVMKNTQPNVAKAVNLLRAGNIKSAKKLISSRSPDVRQGFVFSVPPILAYNLYDRNTYPSNAQQREALFNSPTEEPTPRSAILDL